MSLIGEENLVKPDLMANSVEEVKLKNRRRANKENAERMADVILRKKNEHRLKRKSEQFFTPEKLIKQNIQRLADKKRFKRQSKRLSQKFIKLDADDDLIAVVRIRTMNDSYKSTGNILKSLRLNDDFSMVFLRKTPEILRKLILIEPYVAWGKPNLTTVQELLNKRAFTVIDNKKVAVSDNIMVEDALGDNGVICIADMLHEILTLGSAFEAVNTFLAPFVLTSGLSDMEVRVLHKNKIDSGNQGEKINEIIKSML